ncbi:hypothetical protein DM860_011317 [Cuscuta australis]|uniref:Uncharacterized protein n=1 Tax=Cuscuta australis TaxID=267555 RepID=A0A328DT60_9ASTE|nr:hypothetical protein DM860_011317 [Cuscuta australis]
MAVATVHSQHSYRPNPLRSISWRNGKRLTHFVTTVHCVNKVTSLKCRALSSGGDPTVPKQRVNVFKVSAFRSSSQNDPGSSSRSKSTKKSVKQFSYVPQWSDETSVESLKAHNLPISYPSETVEATTDDTVAIRKLLKHCLSMLRAPSSSQAIGETVEGQSSSIEDIETQNLVQQKERGNIIHAFWSFIMGLGATIKITFLICVPFYLAVNSAYGPEVSKELTPLWIVGPFIVAFYVTMLRAIGALYVFCFKRAVEVVKNLPAYYGLAYDYIARGKLKEEIRARLLQPVVDIKNTDYKKVAMSKMEDMKVVLAEKYVDFTESIWPYYCRTIRFLKKANLI